MSLVTSRGTGREYTSVYLIRQGISEQDQEMGLRTDGTNSMKLKCICMARNTIQQVKKLSM